MESIIRKLLILCILFSGTQIISLPIINFTIFQILLISSFLLIIVDILLNKRLFFGKYLVFSILFILSSFLSLFMSTNKEWAQSNLLLGIMTGMIIFSFSIYFNRNDIKLLEKTIIRSQYIVLPFAILSFYLFKKNGSLPLVIDLPFGTFIQLDEDFIKRGQISGQLRLSLPYATPPVLSLAMAVCIIILFFDKNIFSKTKRWFIMIIYFVILILTGSRTGLIAAGLSFSVYLFSYIYKNPQIFKLTFKKISYFVIILLISFIGLMVVINSAPVYLTKLFYRLTNINLMQDRHFLVPLDGLLIWLDSIKNFIFGIGFGSSANMIGKHTFLPPYFLNSYVTLIVERGITGLFLVFMLLDLKLNIKKASSISSEYRAMDAALLTVMFGCLFYEALNCYLIIFLLGICYVIDSNFYNKYNCLKEDIYEYIGNHSCF